MEKELEQIFFEETQQDKIIDKFENIFDSVEREFSRNEKLVEDIRRKENLKITK